MDLGPGYRLSGSRIWGASAVQRVERISTNRYDMHAANTQCERRDVRKKKLKHKLGRPKHFTWHTVKKISPS